MELVYFRKFGDGNLDLVQFINLCMYQAIWHALPMTQCSDAHTDPLSGAHCPSCWECCWQKAFSCQQSLGVWREPPCSRASLLPWAACIHHLPHSSTRKLKPSQGHSSLKFPWKVYQSLLETAWQLTPHQFCFLPFQSTGIAPGALLDIPPKCNLILESAIERPNMQHPAILQVRFHHMERDTGL